MADDEPSKDRLDELLERINYLESVTRDALFRLHAIETQLGAPRRAPALPARPTVERRREPAAPYEVKPTTPPRDTASTARHDIGSTAPPDAKPLAASSPSDAQSAATTPPRATMPPAPPSLTADARPITTTPSQPPRPRSPLNIPPPQGPPPAFTQVSKPKAGSDLESRIGGSWFNRIGVIAVAVGVIFFLKYAYDNQWIGPREAVMVCVAIGISFLILGERLRPRYRNYAYGLTGGGILILYSSFYAAYRFLDLMGPTPAFICMAIVTATASLLAARYNALPIAVLGLIGGFLTPILLSTGHDNEAGLFGYIALLDLGVLALAYSKQWRALNYMAFASTVAIFIAWMDTWYTAEKLLPTMIFLTLFFCIFALLAVLYNVVNRRPTRWLDLTMVFLNALLYFGTSYVLLESKDDAYVGLFAALVSAFYLALGYFTYTRDREDRLLLYTFWGLAILFLVLAVPIQFKQHWITMGWAIEGAILTWIGLRAEDKTSRYGALIVFLIALSRWLLVDAQDFAYRANEAFTPLLNRRALSSGVLVAALAAAALFYKRFGAKLEAAERAMFAGLYLLGANALAVTLLSMDANDYFEQAKGQAYIDSGWRESFFYSDKWSRLNNARHLTLSALWAIYAATALFVGVKRNVKLLRMGALVLLGIAGAKLLAKDLTYYDAGWHGTFFNPTFIAFVIFIAACAVGVWLYAKAEAVDKEERSLALPVLVGVANLFAIIALSAEAISHFERAKAVAGDQPIAHIENVKQFALSAVWIIYGAVSLLAGIKRHRKFLRAASLALLALAATKVIVVDLKFYNVAWHWTVFNQTFAAFALLIAALAVGAWYYARATGIGEKERAVLVPVLVCAANLLALLALSAEIKGHFERTASAIAQGSPTIELDQLANNGLLAMSALWIIYGAVALAVSIRRDVKALRMGALGLLALATVKVVTVDLTDYDAKWHTLVFNQTFAAFALLVAALATGIWFYSRATNLEEEERAIALPLMTVAAHLLALLALSAEAYGHYAMQINAASLTEPDLRDLRLGQQLSLSVIWTVYGGALLAVGILRRSRLLRVMALLLLSITIGKVFLLDSSFLARGYRIVSFIALGAILLAVSFLYQRYRERVSKLIGDADADAQVGAE